MKIPEKLYIAVIQNTRWKLAFWYIYKTILIVWFKTETEKSQYREKMLWNIGKYTNHPRDLKYNY